MTCLLPWMLSAALGFVLFAVLLYVTNPGDGRYRAGYQPKGDGLTSPPNNPPNMGSAGNRR